MHIFKRSNLTTFLSKDIVSDTHIIPMFFRYTDESLFLHSNTSYANAYLNTSFIQVMPICVSPATLLVLFKQPFTSSA